MQDKDICTTIEAFWEQREWEMRSMRKLHSTYHNAANWEYKNTEI